MRCIANTTFRRQRARVHQRHGVAIVIVLAMISMTLALSYSIMRSQTTAALIQANGSRRALARDAAMTGIAIGYRKMQDGSWPGVDQRIEGSLTATERYEVQYAAGDPLLLNAAVPTSPEYYFSIRILATGYSTHPGVPASTAQASAVVRLIREKRTDRPALLGEQYTVLQTASRDFRVDPPSRIEGPVAVRGDLRVGESYKWKDDARDRYLTDLHLTRESRFEWARVDEDLSHDEQNIDLRHVRSPIPVGSYMYIAGSGTAHRVESSTYDHDDDEATVRVSPPVLTQTGIPVNGASVELFHWSSVQDFRPLTGPVYAPTGRFNTQRTTYLNNVVGVEVKTLSGSDPGAWLPIASGWNYRLFAGGVRYSPESLPDRLENRVLRPDPATNPLGVYVRSGDLTIGNGVTVEGTLVVTGTVNLTGNCTLESLEPTAAQPVYNKLLKLQVENTAVELPVLLAGGDIRVQRSGSGNVRGLVIGAGRFTIDDRHQHSPLEISGRIITSEVNLGARYTNSTYSWDGESSFWISAFDTFQLQLGFEDPMTVHFTKFIDGLGLELPDDNRRCLIKPGPASTYYHWQTSEQPVFIGAGQDGSTRWDIVEWNNPT